jgi:predicted nucleic acid-binding protein
MYLLDTNILSELIKKHPSPSVLSQLSSKPAHTLFTSCFRHFSRIKGLKVENWLEAL